LSLLAADNSRDAQRLRADIYWRQQDWKDEAATFAALVGAAWDRQARCRDAKPRHGLGAALTLGGDNDGLARLRHDFGFRDDRHADAQAFGSCRKI